MSYLSVKLFLGPGSCSDVLGGIQNHLSLDLINPRELHWVDFQVTINFYQSAFCESHCRSTLAHLFLNPHQSSKEIILIIDMDNTSYHLHHRHHYVTE